MTKQEKSELKFLRKMSIQDSVWVTWNIPDGGYTECTACGLPQIHNGLCRQCDNRFDELERLRVGKTR